MKTKVFYLTTKVMVAMFLLAILAVKAFAGETPKLKMVPYSPDKAIIAVDNTTDAAAELTIEDADGYVLYYKEGNIDEKLYSKIFDFKNLTDGRYTITVKNTYGEQAVAFKMVNNKFKLIEGETSYVPYFEVKDNVLKLSFLNHSLDNVELTLTDENGYYFTKDLGNNFSITEGFSIAKLFEGDYAVELKTGNKSFSYNFAK